MDLLDFFESAPSRRFEGTVYRICVAVFGNSLLSMRGALECGGRYNIRNYFGCLYASLDAQSARLEMKRYFTVPPQLGFVEAAVPLRLSRVVDLSSELLLRKAGVHQRDLVDSSYAITQEFGLRAWQAGVEGLLVPSAADPHGKNLAVFLDNQQPAWRIGPLRIRAAGEIG